MTTTVSVQGLRKEFAQRGKPPVVGVDGIGFEVGEGEFVGYAGPNGAGKSTTVKMLAGILVPTAGSVTVAGLVPWRDRKRLTLRMSVVFGQRSGLWWELPLRASFSLVARLYRVPPADAAPRLDELVEALSLGPLLDRPVRALSLGQRMRAELAAAVLSRPEVLFLDEPTIGLDVEAKVVVRDFLRRLNAQEGTTVLLTTHDLDDITALCSRLMVIDAGKLVYDGTVEDLRSAYGTERVLVVDLPADAPELVVEGTTPVRSEGRRRWLSFPRTLSAAAVIERVLAAYDVADLALEEPDLEDVIRRIYRGEVPSGG